MLLVEAAPAKVNLFLHVGALAVDGYHPVCSLMTFADLGDELRLADADTPGFSVDGPFAAGLEGEGNLVLKARDAVDLRLGGLPAFHLALTKSLPVASGVGGGSADAAAALRLLRRRLKPDWPDSVWAALALDLGSDVPACLDSRPCLAEGRGERLSAPPAFRPLNVVLVNPGVAVSTGRVFAEFDARPAPGDLEAEGGPASADFDDVITWLGRQRNDLEAPAVALAPVIARTLETLRAAPETALARLSGSGATCFALCRTAAAAAALAGRLQNDRPDWWVRAGRLSGAP